MSNKLYLANKFFHAICTGITVNTIRRGTRHIELGVDIIEPTQRTEKRGETAFVTRDNLKVDITHLCYKKFHQLTLDDLVANGRPTTPQNFEADKSAFLAEMQEFYPDMTEEDDLTVIYFSYIEGGGLLPENQKSGGGDDA